MTVPSPSLRKKKKKLDGLHGCSRNSVPIFSITVFCSISRGEAESESDGQIPVMGTRRLAMLGHYNISRA